MDPPQVIVLAPGKAKRASLTAFMRSIRGGQGTVNAAIRAGIHRSFDYLRYDYDCRVPVEGKDCVGARYLTIGPLVPCQLLTRDGGTNDLHRFMDRLFRYREDADRAARDVASLCMAAGVPIERCAKR